MDGRELDAEVRKDLRSLSKDAAELVSQHLVATGLLIDDDPQQAVKHARAAAALAGRVGSVREAVGLAAYAAGEWAEALSELRAARRITGRADQLAVMADCERGLGRPERALALLADPDVPHLEQSARVELVIVVAGARRDLGECDAAVLLLQGPAMATSSHRPWAARLWYAYADALLAAGRQGAREWFSRTADIDEHGDTDAVDRLLDLDGVVLADWTEEPDDDQGAARAASAAEVLLALGLERPVAATDASRPPAPEVGDANGRGGGNQLVVGESDTVGSVGSVGMDHFIALADSDTAGAQHRPEGPAFSHRAPAEAQQGGDPEPAGQQELFSDLRPDGPVAP